MVWKKHYIPGGTLAVLGMTLEFAVYWREEFHLLYGPFKAFMIVFFIFMSVHGIFALAAITRIKKDAENFFDAIPTAAADVVFTVAQPQAIPTAAAVVVATVAQPRTRR